MKKKREEIKGNQLDEIFAKYESKIQRSAKIENVNALDNQLKFPLSNRAQLLCNAIKLNCSKLSSYHITLFIASLSAL